MFQKHPGIVKDRSDPSSVQNPQFSYTVTNAASPTKSSFRINSVRPLDELLPEALTAAPPVETGEFRPCDLVNLEEIESTLLLDIRYATRDNFLGIPLYASAHAFLQRPAADALCQAHAELNRLGMGLVVYDAYRPWHVTKMFWEAVPRHLRHFVADPLTGSRHNRGCAVDVGLYDLRTGMLMEMPTDFDEFTEEAHIEYDGASASAKRHRDLLRRTMECSGFQNYSAEWWHFDYEDWREYPILNVPFDELLKQLQGSGSITCGGSPNSFL